MLGNKYKSNLRACLLIIFRRFLILKNLLNDKFMSLLMNNVMSHVPPPFRLMLQTYLNFSIYLACKLTMLGFVLCILLTIKAVRYTC